MLDVKWQMPACRRGNAGMGDVKKITFFIFHFPFYAIVISYFIQRSKTSI